MFAIVSWRVDVECCGREKISGGGFWYRLCARESWRVRSSVVDHHSQSPVDHHLSSIGILREVVLTHFSSIQKALLQSIVATA